MLTFGITGSAADNSLFSIDSSTGVLTFDSAPDFDTAGDANGDNVYEVEVSVSDGTNSTTQSISITVTGEEDNAPIITSSSTPSVAENTTAVVTVAASDADLPGDTLSFGISGDGGAANADDGLFTINSSTGALSFVNAPDFENPSDTDGDNDYLVRVWASDGTTRVSQDLTVSVTGANDIAPETTSDDSVRVPAVGTAVLTVTATDEDLPGDTLTFGITGSGADDARFAIDSVSGELTFLADPASAADANMDGVYEAQVSVNDGATTVTQDISVNVTTPEVGVAVSDEGELIIGDLADTDTHLTVAYDAVAGEYVATSAMPTLALGTLTMDSIDTSSNVLPTNEVRVDELLVTEAIMVFLEAGDDLLDASTLNIDVFAFGGDGDDTIDTGDGDDTALGGAGHDAIDAGDGDDIVRVQSGNDEIDGGLGVDMIRGGRGSNEVADNVSGTVTVDGDSVSSDSGDDIRHASAGLLLRGSENADIFNAAMATVSIEIEGNDGDDVITGSPDDDLLFGGDGNDIIVGGDGDDLIDGGDGDDDIMGDDGDDAIRGGLGNDRLNGNQGHDTMLGGDGNDSLFGGGQADLLLGEDGLDHVRGQAGDDTVTGAGNGSVRVNPGDNVKGGAGTNVIDDAFSFDFDALLPTDD